ncbi:Gfo/Idh/MocA family oxidoreductase [Streptomyces sp. NPDC052101]|uniref:Gfo/Idh/MocA family protein n=1 Tax=Streptomyces sp. NPDC052101 TaxID=3155763 RepID=UPI00342D8F41
MRTLLVGAGEVGSKHLAALAATPGFDVAAVADPAQRRSFLAVPLFAGHHAALRTIRPELVIVATPPGNALDIARDAARTGATVLVEKPVTTRPADLAHRAGDERIHVAFQPHFAPGLAELLAHPPGTVRRAEVLLTCRRDPHYYRGWRQSAATAGGVLHQQAIHGLALALRLLGHHQISSCRASVARWRQLAETEDRVQADLIFHGGQTLTIAARVDAEGPARHEITLHDAVGHLWHVRGRNLEAGLGPTTEAPTHQALRQQMYQALRAVHHRQPAHPCLFPLPALRHPLEVIEHVYRHAHHRSAPAA